MIEDSKSTGVGREMLNKVPEVTLYFWIIKILCTTVGETFSDYLNSTLGLGLTKTTLITGAVLLVALVVQFLRKKYVPGIYWFVVVLLSIVGTQITDNLHDNMNVSLATTTSIFSVALALTFVAWYFSEKTLSVHSIVTSRREAFYWTAILFTFALGTASGDLLSEKVLHGYGIATAVFAGSIALVTFAHWKLKLNHIVAFWVAYILTRPLGASLGDSLSQARSDGGLGLGSVAINVAFLVAILVLVVFLSVTKKDVIDNRGSAESSLSASRV